MQHHQMTKPLLDMWFLPQKLVFIGFFSSIFLVGGLKVVYSNLKKYNISKGIFLVLVLILLATPLAAAKYDSYVSNMWVQYGMNLDPQGEMMYELGDYLKNALGNDETVLAHDETSFGITAISGKHVVISRRTHASYFVDVDKRVADAAVMMYSNDIEKVEELLKGYNVRYFYVDGHLIKSYMLTRPEFSDYLADYGVDFQLENIKLDPAQPDEIAYKQDMLLIPPQEFGVIEELIDTLAVSKIDDEIASILYEVKV